TVKTSVVNGVKAINGNSPSHQLFVEFPQLTETSITIIQVKHNIEQCIMVTGLPSANSRQLNRSSTSSYNQEFSEHLIVASPDIVFRSWLFIQSWIRAKCSQIPPPTAFAVEGNSKGETPATPAAIAVGEKPALLSPDAIPKDTENFFAAHKERIRMLTLSRRKGYLRPPAKTRRSSRKCTLN
ncbi:hypothetical protein NPIL_485751, partial [Nephila pilipes]